MPSSNVSAAPLLPADERIAMALLVSASGVGSAALDALAASVGSARTVLDVAGGPDGERILRHVLGPERETAVAGLGAAARTAADHAAQLERAGLTILLSSDPQYPPRLRTIRDAPPVLFVAGDPDAFSASSVIAVVGTRRPTEAGRRTAGRIAAALATLDAVVVSGLAVGIDGAAHAAAVEARATTVAVLGGGHDQLFPRAHRRLAAGIVAAGGAVVSEVGPWVRPARWSFPRRNRIISGLSQATVVVEAGRVSGALITARSALEQGRDVFVVPGAIDDRTAAGCLELLRSAPGVVRVVAGIPQLLVDLGLTESKRQPGRGTAGAALADAGPIEREIGALIAAGTGTVDELVAATELPVATVLAAVTLLETRGVVIDALGRYRPAGVLAARIPGRRRARAPEPGGRGPPRGSLARSAPRGAAAAPPSACTDSRSAHRPPARGEETVYCVGSASCCSAFPCSRSSTPSRRFADRPSFDSR